MASIRTVTQEDPIGLAGGLNFHGFADGDPINFSDQIGLRPPDDNNTADCTVILGAGAISNPRLFNRLERFAQFARGQVRLNGERVGDSREEALANIAEAVHLYLEPVEDDPPITRDAEVVDT